MEKIGVIKCRAQNASMDLSGQRFGRLIALNISAWPKPGVFWLCQCDCGNTATVNSYNLRKDLTHSCGCIAREMIRKRSTRHGHASVGCESKEFRTWLRIIERCTNKARPDYARYGGRGIRVCDEWRSDFMAFYRDMGPRPSHRHSIDRIDVDGDYTASNCRWATTKEQNNNKRNNHQITYDGKTQTIAMWADELGVAPWGLYKRRRRHTDPAFILFGRARNGSKLKSRPFDRTLRKKMNGKVEKRGGGQEIKDFEAK